MQQSAIAVAARLGLAVTVIVMLIAACGPADQPPAAAQAPAAPAAPVSQPSRYDIYATVRLSADTSNLSANQKRMLPLLIEASEIMDDLFWLQAWGDKSELLDRIDDPAQRRFAEINYGRGTGSTATGPLSKARVPNRRVRDSTLPT